MHLILFSTLKKKSFTFNLYACTICTDWFWLRETFWYVCCTYFVFVFAFWQWYIPQPVLSARTGFFHKGRKPTQEPPTAAGGSQAHVSQPGWLAPWGGVLLHGSDCAQQNQRSGSLGRFWLMNARLSTSWDWSRVSTLAEVLGGGLFIQLLFTFVHIVYVAFWFSWILKFPLQ